jgi:predicted secreted protein
VARFAAPLLALLPALLAQAGPASAGDYAEREILGFSPDGQAFAFEQYGETDTDEWPYAAITILDTATGAPVEAGAIAIATEDDALSLGEVRRRVHAEAAPLLAKYGIGEPGTLVASNPALETSANPHFVAFMVRRSIPPMAIEWRLTLTEIAFPSGAECTVTYPTVYGFRLVLEDPGRMAHTMHEDAALPDGRRCATGYGISDVLDYFPGDGHPPVLVVLVNVFSQGYEGPDRRFTAVAMPFREEW